MARPAGRCSTRADVTAVQLGDPAHDGEAEAGAAGVGASGICSVEALEDLVGRYARQARARVRDSELDPPISFDRADPHRCAPVTECVLDQVEDDLVESFGIGRHDKIVGDRDVHLGVRLIEQAFVHGTGDEPAQVDLRGRQHDGAGLQAGEIEQILDEAVEPLDPPVHRPQELRRRLADAVDEVLQSRFQAGDRGTQLVRDVGHQVAALPIGQREVGSHRVERRGELADLVDSRCLDRFVGAAAGDALGGLGHRPQRTGHAPSQELDDDKGDGGSDDGPHPDRPTECVANLARRDRHTDGGDDDDRELPLDRSHAPQRRHQCSPKA